MVLTDTAIRNAKPKEKPYKVTDSQGLYLLVNPSGSKLWHRIDQTPGKISNLGLIRRCNAWRLRGR
jgi:hypothetical protein